MDYSLPGPSVCGILQARILEWVAISFSSIHSTTSNFNVIPKQGTLCWCTYIHLLYDMYVDVSRKKHSVVSGWLWRKKKKDNLGWWLDRIDVVKEVQLILEQEGQVRWLLVQLKIHLLLFPPLKQSDKWHPRAGSWMFWIGSGLKP